MKQHLTPTEMESWSRQLQQCHERYMNCKAGDQPFTNDVITDVTNGTYAVPQIGAVAEKVISLLPRASLNTKMLSALTTEEMLKSWMPLFVEVKSAQISAQPHPTAVHEARCIPFTREALFSDQEILDVCAPPPDIMSQPRDAPILGQLESDKTEMQHAIRPAIYVGRVQLPRPRSENMDLVPGSIILMLRPLSSRSKSNPFWVAKVESWASDTKRGLVHWYAAWNPEKTWDDSAWGEGLSEFTQDHYDQLPLERRKGKYAKKNIGKFIEDCKEELELSEENVFMYDIQLHQTGKFSRTTIRMAKQKLVEESIRFHENK